MLIKCQNRIRAVSTAVIVVIVAIVVIAAGAGIFLVRNTSSTTTSISRSPLIIYVADAYTREATALAGNFTSATGISAAPVKSAGSLALAQQIAQGNPVSVFIPVSRQAVEEQYLNNRSSGWAISFAGDQMAITYSNATLQNSAGNAVVNSYDVAASTNTTRAWYNFFNNLTSGLVKVGLSNPNTDPAGYRAWIVLEAAGYVYANNMSYFTDRLQYHHGNVSAPSAAGLIAPLQAGQIQFLFIYKSAAVAQSLNRIQLAGGINLGLPSYASFYSKFNYTITTGVMKGAPIALWITVPKDSTDVQDSLTFVVFVIKHASMLTSYGLTVFAPAKLYNSTDNSVPAPVSQLVSQGQLQYTGSAP